jgi:uncharacterized membrane protein YphA (DoxX/SURF4 family)
LTRDDRDDTGALMSATRVSERSIFAPPVPSDEFEPASSHEPWSRAKRLRFRFVACYFLLYSLASYIGSIPFFAAFADGYSSALQWLTVRTGRHVLHLTASLAIVPTASGDTLRNYVHNFVVLSLAVAGALAWSIVDRRRSEYNVAREWLTAFVRFSLAITMFGYGLAKIVPTQMPAPGPDRWIEPLGEYSPMGLLWTFMGYSYVYQIFTGLGEAIGGLLLCFRRTTTVGALLLTVVLSNVVMLNYTFDVPVKIYSTNLLIMAAFLLAPDVKRLVNLLVLNRSVAARELRPLFPSQRASRIAAGLVCLQLGFVFYENVSRGLAIYRQSSPTGPVPALFGVYDVVEFTRNGIAVPPLSTDATRWSRVAFTRGNRAVIRSTPDSVIRLVTTVQTVSKTILFTGWDQPLKWTFDFEKSGSPAAPNGDERIVLTGLIGSDSIAATLQRVDDSRFLLLRRGFHWVQEQPFIR